MSVAEPTLDPEFPLSDPPQRPGPTTAAVAVRVVLVVLLLGVSGGLRFWQERQVEASLLAGLKSPYPLTDLPMELGDWRGHPDELDPQIVRRTGSTDIVSRTYVNQKTGVRLAMIVLYGPAADVSEHAPEICYPLAGYTQSDSAHDLKLSVDDEEAPYIRSLVYRRGKDGELDRQEVYYSWYYTDRWTPKLVALKKIERVPAMFKVHVARPLAERELPGGDANPCQEFLKQLLPEMKQRLAAARSQSSGAVPG